MSASPMSPPGNPDPVQTALELKSQGRLREALQALSVPGDFPADFYVLRGDIQLEIEQIKEAAGSYFTAAASEPDNLYAQLHLALCLRRLKRWEGAAEAFQAVLKIEPHRDQARIDLGECLLHLDRAEEALACFDQCWTEAARRKAWFGKAVALQLLRRFEEAEADYQRLLVLDPKAEEALSNLISMSVEMFDLTRIERYGEQLLKLNPRSQVALHALTLLAVERQDFEKASQYWDRIEQANVTAEHVSDHQAQNSIEYRLSRRMVDAITEARQNRSASRAQAAGAFFGRA